MRKNVAVTEPNILISRGSDFTHSNTKPWRGPHAFL